MTNAKVVLVTGANKGIGLETAKQLAKEGCEVILGARKEAEAQSAATAIGGNAHALRIDMTDSASFRHAADWIEQKFGRLDVLINNAGIGPDMGMKPSEIPPATVREVFETNVFGLVELTQQLLPLLRKSGAGRIVNLSSILGSLTMNANPEAPIGDKRAFGYNGSKAALNMFTATLAFELKDTKIKVNSAHPGWVKTELGGSEAPLEVVDGAKTSVMLAKLGPDGPTGSFFHMGETLPW